MKEIEAEIASIKDSIAKMSPELAKDPFTWEAAAAATTHLGYILVALDAALAKVAKKAAEKEPDLGRRESLERDIRNISEPWVDESIRSSCNELSERARV